MKKISEEKREEIRQLKASGTKIKEIAEAYGVSAATIYNIIYPEKYLQANERKKARWAAGYYKKKKEAEPEVKTIATTDTKAFRLTVSGVTCIVNVPASMSMEAEITEEALIFNIK